MDNKEMLDLELQERFQAAIEAANAPEDFFNDGTMEEMRDILDTANGDIDKVDFEGYVKDLKARVED